MSRGSAAADPRAEAVPAAVAPPPGNPRFRLIDSLRAVAALSVLVFHTALLSGVGGDAWTGKVLGQLNVGVTIFFLISGFLLYRPYAVERAGGAPALQPGDYFWRRALRILPAYWLALLALAIWPGLTVVDGDWWVLATLQQTNPLVHDPGPCLAAGGCGLPQTWSLSAELGFYVLLPFVAPLLARLRRPLVALGLLSAASLAFLAFAIGSYPEHPRLFVTHLGLPGTFLWFACGMALAWLSVASEGRESRALRLVERRPWLCWLGSLACLAVLAALPAGAVDGAGEAARHLLRHALLALLALLLMLPAVFGREAGGWPRRVLANPVLAWLGLVSYGVFLWHYTLAAELSERMDEGFAVLTALTVAVAVTAAAVSYYGLERPVLRLKRTRPRLPRWLPRWAIVVFAVALAVRMALIVATPGFEPVLDPWDYDRHAVSIAGGDGYPDTVIAADKDGPTAFRPPLYPHVLASVYALSGNSWTGGRLLGALLGALAALLVALLAGELWGRRAGIAAGAVAAVSPPLVALNASLSAEALFIPLELGALLAIWLCVKGGGAMRWALAAGALCGLATLTRGNGLVLVAPLLLALLPARLPGRRRLALAAAALGALALTLVPWTIRNSIEFDTAGPLSTQLGITASGTYGPLPMNDERGKGAWRPPFPDPLYRDLFRRDELDEVDLEREARRRAVDFVGEHPAYPFEVLALNTARLLHPEGTAWLADDSYVELGVRDWMRPLVTVGHYAVALLALLALALAARRSASGRLGPPWLWVAALLMLLSAAAFSGAPRYRAPLDPFLTLLAGLAIATIAERLRAGEALRQPAAEQRAEHTQSV